MSARNISARSTPRRQGRMKRRLETTSCSRSVVVRIPDHSRHVLLRTSRLLGLRMGRHRRVTGMLGRHLRCVARLGHWRLAVTQGHRAVQMNFGNSRLHGHCADLFPALHGLCGRLLFRGQSIPSSTCNIPPGHAAQSIVDRITWNARRVNLCAARQIVILCLHSVQAHFLCSGIFKLAQAGTQSEQQTADSSGHALACENPGGAVASAFLHQLLAPVRCCL